MESFYLIIVSILVTQLSHAEFRDFAKVKEKLNIGSFTGFVPKLTAQGQKQFLELQIKYAENNVRKSKGKSNTPKR